MTILSRALATQTETRDTALSLSDWAQNFTFGGLNYPFIQAGTQGQPVERIESNFPSYVQQAYKQNGVVFACMLARLMLFSEARFQFRQRRAGRPGDLFGTPDLAPLETPWTNATTGDLLTRAIQDVDLAGNFYAHRPGRVVIDGKTAATGENTIRRLRPDWVTIVLGSQSDPDNAGVALDAELACYIYHPGGYNGPGEDAKVLMPEEVAHFAPIPDPAFRFRGMSWITPIVREIMGDQAGVTHKLEYLENGAVPNTVVSVPTDNLDKFDKFVAKMVLNHEGVANKFKTLYLGAGSTAQVIGSNMRQVDFKALQAVGETRIASAAGVPPIIVGLSEGLAASTYSNFQTARRLLSDLTMRPLWRNMAGSMAPLIDVPNGAELWYDDTDISFLQEDVKDDAEIQQIRAATIKSLIDAGYKPDSVVSAVTASDMSRLVHTGLYSVQLQPPGTVFKPTVAAPDPAPALAASKAQRALEAITSASR